MRTGTTLSYLLSDHLGSSSLTTDANGVTVGESLYKAFGESRYTLGSLNTDYQFTGQREEASLGIYFFQARWYDGTLGRFLSPDSLVPASTQGTQAWDRYAFVNNNPVRYTDPTGHWSIPFGFSTDSLRVALTGSLSPAYVSNVFDGIATLLDLGAETLDLTAVAISVGIATSGTAYAGPAGTLVGVPAGEFFATPFVIAGNIAASVASGLSIASDIVTGDTSINVSGELTENSIAIDTEGTIGPDTQVAGASFILGWTIPTSYASLIIQSGVVAYDVDSQLPNLGMPNLGLSDYIDPIEFDVDEEYEY